jgi:hypothetical protein
MQPSDAPAVLLSCATAAGMTSCLLQKVSAYHRSMCRMMQRVHTFVQSFWTVSHASGKRTQGTRNVANMHAMDYLCWASQQRSDLRLFREPCNPLTHCLQCTPPVEPFPVGTTFWHIGGQVRHRAPAAHDAVRPYSGVVKQLYQSAIYQELLRRESWAMHGTLQAQCDMTSV